MKEISFPKSIQFGSNLKRNSKIIRRNWDCLGILAPDRLSVHRRNSGNIIFHSNPTNLSTSEFSFDASDFDEIEKFLTFDLNFEGKGKGNSALNSQSQSQSQVEDEIENVFD